jgi:hypothetical protein
LVHWHSWVFSACAVAKAGEAGILNADNPGDVLWSFCDDADRSARSSAKPFDFNNCKTAWTKMKL